MSDEPQRWTEDPETPDGLADALRDARGELPDDAQLAAVAAKLGPLLGGGGGGGAGGGGGSGGLGAGSAAAKTAAVGMASGTKIVLFLLGGSVVIAALGSWAVIADRRARPPQRYVDAAEIAPDGGATPLVAPGVDSSTDDESPIEDLPEGLGEPEAEPEVRPRTRPQPEPSPRQPPSGPSELVLLRQAQDALPVSPAVSLDLAEAHRERFPNGALAQEREVLAVHALLRLGRREAAEARAARFRGSYPGSSQIRRLDRLLSLHQE